MKKAVFAVLGAIMVVGCVAGCSQQTAAAVDPEQTIDCGTGKLFVIALDANPTTGYSWQATFDEGLIELEKEWYTDDKAPGLVGAGGTQYFQFKTLESGATDVLMRYMRPWESAAIEEKTFQIDIG